MRKFFILIAALSVMGCGKPDVRFADLDGENGTNNVFRIKIDRDAECPRAVYAQELFEALEKRDPVYAARVRLDRSVQRIMEVQSHEIETQAAVQFCGATEATSRRAEAAAMLRGYDGLFSNWNAERIEREMLNRKGAAIHWLKKHEKDLTWK